MRVSSRVRPLTSLLVGLPFAGVAIALTVSAADGAAPYAATASVAHAPQYLGDSAGTAFTFTVTNTGTDASIGAVEVVRPSNGWSVTSCGTAGTWSVQKADPKCRYRSGSATTDDIAPGQSRQFTVTATTQPGTENRVGTWHVTVSKSNQFDNPSLLTAAEPNEGDLRSTAYTWEVLDAVVRDTASTPGSACPPSDKDALTSSTNTIVVCGRNHATIGLTPTAGYSSLSGTFLAESGTFSSGPIVANSGPVVVANWSNAKVVSLPGQNLTVVATVGSAANRTSPVTTLGGYEAINAPPVAEDDTYSVAEDGSLSEPAPGVLDNDSDPEGQPMTAVLENGPAHAASFTLHADGSFDYEPVADYNGGDSFTYRAHDGIQASNDAATVEITVTAVNDAPVNTAPASVSTEEETAYVFAPGALSVSDVDSGAADVETNLSVAHATVTVGTTGVTVTGNSTGSVTVTGPVTAVAAAIDGATLTPANAFSGSTTLTVTTSDLGHTGSGGVLTDTDDVTVSVLFVNDAPTFTPGTDQTVNEDAGTQTVTGWATAIDAGEPGQTVSFEVTNDDNTLFSTQPAISAAGTLTYRPANDRYGTATVTVTLHDDGGTANGGDDTSDPVTFAITVNAVNDAPAAANQARTAHTNMGISISGLLAGASDTADAGDPAYTPSFTLGTVTAASCAGCGIGNVNPNGSFDFTPPPGGTGNYTLSYTVVDTGYPGPGVASAPATITVTVSGPVIWFVDPSVAGPGNGTMSDPFKALTSATALAGANHKIFVADGTVTGNVAQATGAWLVGEGVTGASFDAVMMVTPPAGTHARPPINGTRPTITGGVSVADSSVVRGVDLAPAAGTVGVAGLGDDAVTVGETSVTASGARAVDVVASQGSTLSFTRVSSSGGANGIRLQDVNTTSAGSFAVTGTGSTGSGGTIASATGAGVSLVRVTGTSLSWLAITGSAAEGVSGSDFEAFSMTDSTVSGSGTHGLSLANLRGASSLTRVTASGSAADNARLFSSAGSTAFTVTDSTFRDNSATSGGNGLLVQADGNAAITFTSSGSSFLRNRQDGLAAFGHSTAKMTATVTNPTVVTDRGVGIELTSNGTGGMAYGVSGGSVTGCAICGSPVVVYKATGATGTGANALAGTISGMTINNGNSPNAPGIWVRAEGAGASRTAVTNNVITGVAHQGIFVGAGNGGSTMDATVTGNTITAPLGGLQSIQVDSGTLTTDTTSVCADLRTNVIVNAGSNDIRVRNRQAGTAFRLPGYAGSATDTTAVQLFLISQNTIADAAAVVGSSPGFGGGAACATP
jgi:hypothetical protein